MKAAVFLPVVMGLALSASAQKVQTGAQGAMAPLLAQAADAPAGQAHTMFFMDKDLHGRFEKLIAEAKSKGVSSAVIADFGTYKILLSALTKSGGAEEHAHWDDVMIVKQGHATLLTGGTIENGKTDGDGETRGAKVENGNSQTIGPGDVVTVRANTPHQVMVAPGTVYTAVVVKVHES